MSIATHVTIQKKDKFGNPLFDENGQPVLGVAINPVKPFVRGFWMPGISITGGTPTSAPVVAASGSVLMDFIVDSQGHFDWSYIMGVSTGAFVLNFFDAGKNRDLQNRPIHSSLIVGSAQRPFRLPEPYFLNVGDAQRNIRVKVTDISGAPNTVRLYLYGRRFYHKEADPDVGLDISKHFGEGERAFSYFMAPEEANPTDGSTTAVAALGTAIFTFRSDSHYDTEITKMMATSTGAFTVQLFDDPKKKFLSNDVIHSNDAFGNAEFPMVLDDSFLLERQKALLFMVTDLSGAPNSIYFCLAGKRLNILDQVGK